MWCGYLILVYSKYINYPQIVLSSPNSVYFQIYTSNLQDLYNLSNIGVLCLFRLLFLQPFRCFQNQPLLMPISWGFRSSPPSQISCPEIHGLIFRLINAGGKHSSDGLPFILAYGVPDIINGIILSALSVLTKCCTSLFTYSD